jgi:hypothetical protein
MKGITFLPTTNLALTNAFYHGVLDLEPALDQGGCVIYRVGQAYWGFCQSEEPLADPERVVLTLVCDEVDDWYTLLQDAPPRENERYRIYHFYAKDPNGYRFEVQKFLHPFA